MDSMGGHYATETWTLGGKPAETGIHLSASEWKKRLAGLASQVGGSASALRTQRPGTLEEEADAFIVTGVLSQSEREVTTATVVWPKRPFDAWWSEESGSIDTTVAAVASATSLATPAFTGCVNDAWSRMPIEVADPRFYQSTVWTGSEMVVWGGINIVPVNTGGVYTPATDTWRLTSVGAGVPTPRSQASAVWAGTTMIVWGGLDDSGNALDTGGRYNPVSDSWAPTSTGPNTPVPRLYHTAVWTGSRMIIWGGETAYSGGTVLNSGGRYDPISDTWSSTSEGANNPPPMYAHVAVWADTQNRMIVWGWPDSVAAQGGRYDPISDSWSPMAIDATVTQYVSYETAVWTGTEMIVWGGLDGGFAGRGGRYNPTSDSWHSTSIGVNAPSGRIYHTAVWTGSVMLVWGGYDRTAAVDLNTGGRYDPVSDSWQATSTGPNVPQARSGATAVWANGEMIVWGGGLVNDNIAYNTGGRYNPTSNTWLRTSTGATTPRPRQSHTAVWDGAEMIVWGGDSAGLFFNTGGRYTPSTNSWAATSLGANVPTARSNHTAVWSGSEMIVWGGGAGPALPTGNGARYNPAANTWAPVATGTNVPSPRQWHGSVWAADRMVVWGGQDSSGVPLANGGRYDPSTNTWLTPPTATGAPTARRRHSAVSTGSKMIVWGGSDGSGPLSTGGVYDPAGDTWSGTSALNAPAAREYHTAVWTGSRMIVWGGLANSTELQTGGRYDPVANSWAATSTGANVPSARDRQAAIWTGSEMIVWGGRTANQFGTTYTNTGARYDPLNDAWIPTGSSGNPGFVGDPKAVWAVSETQMAVWGGETANNGGLYCASCVMATWYQDLDGDGYGSSVVQFACGQPAGYVAATGDCDDGNPSIHPGLADNCNNVDDDCDGSTDEDYVSQLTSCGIGGCARVGSTSCVSGVIQDSCVPGTPQPSDTTCDGIDDNCNGQVDEGFTPQADGWNELPTAGAPTPRTQFAAAASTGALFVWGGHDGSAPLNTGGMYRPATDAWTATSTAAPVPSARRDVTAVWSGFEMLVWGGTDGSNFFNTGGRYNPGSDQWTPIQTPNGTIPGRSSHTAVWTGSLMLVWGGLTSAGTATGTGGSYNPGTNSWSSLSTSGPSPRYNHTAVFTSSNRMIVWGGESSGAVFGDGKIYDPSANSWSSVATSGAPSARTRHTAVWTGARMIVFGGYNGVTYLADGASYDPGANSWTPIAPLPGPGRAGHVAVWDPNNGIMIVWGGISNGPLNDGYKYSPATNSWSPISFVGLSPRQRAAGFWINGETIIWGGGQPTPLNTYNDGARYTAVPFGCGLGACTRESRSRCDGGIQSYLCTAGLPSPESCNRIDDDCDGTVDNNVGGTPGISCLQEGKGGFATLSSVSWTAFPSAISYDVIRGALSTLRSTGGNYTPATTACVANDTTALGVSEPNDPPLGDALFHLLRPNFAGGPGTYDEGVSSQIGSRDAEIAASPSACP